MVTPVEDPQVHGQGPGRVSLSDSSGTEGGKSDSYQVFPDYSQLVPDRTLKHSPHASLASHRLPVTPISYIMSSYGCVLLSNRVLQVADYSCPRHGPMR